MAAQRRRFTDEFKLEAIRLAAEKGMTARSAARHQLGIPENHIYRWRRELSSDASSAFPGNGKRKPDDERMIQLERENTKLKAQVQLGFDRSLRSLARRACGSRVREGLQLDGVCPCLARV